MARAPSASTMLCLIALLTVAPTFGSRVRTQKTSDAASGNPGLKVISRFGFNRLAPGTKFVDRVELQRIREHLEYIAQQLNIEFGTRDKDALQRAIVAAGEKGRPGTRTTVNFGPFLITLYGDATNLCQIKPRFDVAPKFNFGVSSAHFYAMAGLRDVRNGITLEAYANVHKMFTFSASNFEELFRSLKATDVLVDFDEDSGEYSIEKIIETMSHDVSDVLHDLKDKLGIHTRDIFEIEGSLFVYKGLGVSAGVFLGLWADNKGYFMTGVKGKLASALDLDFSFAFGMHKNRQSVRLVMFFMNVGFDLVLKLHDYDERQDWLVLGGPTVSNEDILFGIKDHNAYNGHS